MIIDMHTHVYPKAIAERALDKLQRVSGIFAKTNGVQSGLRDSMQKTGIAYSLLLPVATSAKQVDKINEEAGEINAGAKETGLLSFGGIHPDTEDYKEVLLRVKALGLKGIKLHPDYQGTFFDDIRYKRIVAAATELGLYIMVHAGEDIGLPDPVHCRPEHVLRVMDETETDKLILAHMGGWRLWGDVREKLAGNRKLYFDTAFSLNNLEAEGVQGMLDEKQFVELVRAHGSDRILFGTDSPWSDQKSCVDWIRGTALTEEEKEQIFSGNARRILGV